MPIQGSMARDEVQLVLFQEENTEPRNYAMAQTPEADAEDQLRASVESKRPGTSDQQDLIETLR